MLGRAISLLPQQAWQIWRDVLGLTGLA